MTIGEISQEIGLSADTLRYYEKIGLLPNVPRDNSGKRNYDENFINWIKFIQTTKLYNWKRSILLRMLSTQNGLRIANYHLRIPSAQIEKSHAYFNIQNEM